LARTDSDGFLAPCLNIKQKKGIQSDDVDASIQHELNLEEDPYEVEVDVSACLKELSFPYSAQEPDLPQEELQRLDALADQVEVQRLIGLEVLKDDNLPLDCKALSTRFVRTWREKKNEAGDAIWLRRSADWLHENIHGCNQIESHFSLHPLRA